VHTSSSCLLFGAAVEFEPIELDELVDDPDVVEPSLPLPFGDLEFGTTKSLESSCFTSNNAARPMLYFYAIVNWILYFTHFCFGRKNWGGWGD